MRNKHRSDIGWLLLVSLCLVNYCPVVDADDVNEENGGGHLLTRLNCKPGQQTEYVMATQSSLLEKFEDANLLIKTKLAVRCLSKHEWVNTTSGETLPGQMYEARILSVHPIQLAPGTIPSLKTGKLQMSELFNVLDSTPSDASDIVNATGNGNNNKKGGPNIKVGAVNKFFEEFATSFGELVMELFRRLVKVFEQLIQRRKDNPNSKTSPVSLTCPAKAATTERGARRRFVRSPKGATFAKMNTNDYRGHLSELYRLPWTFLQLEEGTVVEVKLSPLETMPNVKNFKHFISGAFSTQLNEASKERVEKSSLGEHKSHYQIEYELSREGTESLLNDKKRLRRASYPLPVVSVVRSVRSSDILKLHGERNHLRHRKLFLEDLDFTAQQVQLVEGNVLVASGGHFRSIMPLEMPAARTIRRDRRSLKEEFDATPHFLTFDDNLRHGMTMNLEYSMVRVDDKKKNNNKKRTKREAGSDDAQRDMIHYARRLSTILESAQRNEQLRRKRAIQRRHKRQDSKNDESDIKCHKLDEAQLIKLARQVERESNVLNVESDSELDDAKQCHEHKEFGSRLFRAYFNRTVTSRGFHKNSNGVQGRRSDKEYFDTNFRVGAQFMGEDVTVGHVHLASHRNRSRLSINLFGSEYVDLDLCEIRNKTFSQANLVPLFNENIWFMTNVGVKVKYDFDLHVNVPDEICGSVQSSGDLQKAQTMDSSSSNAAIISKFGQIIDSNQAAFGMKQKSRLNLAASLDASFLVFNAEMRVNGHFDVDSNVDFGQKCLTARSDVQPMNVSMDFNYKFFHPVCNEWMEDNWKPKHLHWELTPNYRSSWFDDSCSA